MLLRFTTLTLSGLHPDTEGELFYEDANCNSPALIDDRDGVLDSFYRPATVRGTTLYYGASPATGTTYTLQAYSHGTNDGRCLSYTAPLPVVPAATLDLGGFVPPFHVEAQP